MKIGVLGGKISRVRSQVAPVGHKCVLYTDIRNADRCVRVGDNGHEAEPTTLLGDGLHEPALW